MSTQTLAQNATDKLSEVVDKFNEVIGHIDSLPSVLPGFIYNAVAGDLNNFRAECVTHRDRFETWSTDVNDASAIESCMDDWRLWSQSASTSAGPMGDANIPTWDGVAARTYQPIPGQQSSAAQAIATHASNLADALDAASAANDDANRAVVDVVIGFVFALGSFVVAALGASVPSPDPFSKGAAITGLILGMLGVAYAAYKISDATRAWDDAADPTRFTNITSAINADGALDGTGIWPGGVGVQE